MDYSVLMTVYKNDRPEYLKESIDSMLNQTIPTNDFVLVQDGPITSNLQEVIQSYIERYADIFNIVVLPENVGLGTALRKGIMYCRNEFVARMDDDDIACKNRCQLQLKEFKDDPTLDLVGSYVDEFSGEKSNIVGQRKVPLSQEDILDFSHQRNPFNHSTVMFRKSKVLNCGNYSEMRTNQDVELWIRMLHMGCKTKNIQQSLVLFRFDNNTLQKRKDWKNIKLLVTLWKEFYKKRYCSYCDFFKVRAVLIFMKIVPMTVLKWMYKNLR